MDTAGGLYADIGPNVQASDIQDPMGDNKRGRVEYSVFNPQTGESGKIDDNQLIMQLTRAGMRPGGLSPDAKLASFHDDHGEYQAPVEQVLQKLGWQVQGKNILDSDTSNVSAAMRYAIDQPMLANDEAAKKRYLEYSLMKQGVAHPIVEGSGTDWHMYDPRQGKYYALTNAPGLDFSDLGGMGAKAPGFVGAGVGMTMGAGTGPLTGPLGAMGGAAAGGAAGNALSTGIASSMDPEFRRSLSERGGMDMAKDVAGQAGSDALGGAAGFGLGKVAQGLGRAGWSPLSSTAKGVGVPLEAGGKLVGGVGQWAAESPNARDVALSALNAPGMGAGPWAAQSAGEIPGAIGKGLDWGKNIAQRGLDAAGRGMQRTAEHEGFQNFAGDEIASKMWEHSARAREMASRMASKTSKAFQPGLSGEQQMRRNAIHMGGGQGAADFAGGLGETMENVGKVGQALQKPAQAAWQMGARTIQGAGRAAQHTGAAMRGVGNAMQPYEAGLSGHLGSEELYQVLKRRQRALQAQGFNPKLVPEDQLVDFDPATMPGDVTGSY